MSDSWYPVHALHLYRLKDLPRSQKGIRERAQRDGWPGREVPGKGGPGGTRVEYQPPPDIQSQIDVIEAQRAREGAVVDGVEAQRASAHSEMTAVAYYDVRTIPGVNTFIARGVPSGSLLFPSGLFANRIGANATDLAAIQMPGENMEPTLCYGDLLMVDRGDTAVTDGVYAWVLEGNLLFVNRLQRRIDKVILMLNEDRDKPPALFPKLGDYDQPSLIVGRVIWADRRL